MQVKVDYKKLEDYWYVLCESKDVKKKPKNFKLLGTPIVVYRDANNKALAFIDRCPHRNVWLSKGKIINGNLQCPYHGWEFNTDGKCVNLPGMVDGNNCDKIRAPKLKKFDLIEQEGFIWLKLNPRSDKKPHLPAHLYNKDMKTYEFRTHLKSNIVNLAESFLDPFHTPFVHDGIIRTEGIRAKNEIHPKHIENGLEVLYYKERGQSGFISKFGPEVKKDLGRFLMPGIIELEYFSENRMEYVNTMYLTPRSETESSVYFKASVSKQYIPRSIIYLMAGFAMKFALNQDKTILQQQSEVIETFGQESFANTQLDIVKKQLDNLYQYNGKKVDFEVFDALI